MRAPMSKEVREIMRDPEAAQRFVSQILAERTRLRIALQQKN